MNEIFKENKLCYVTQKLALKLCLGLYSDSLFLRSWIWELRLIYWFKPTPSHLRHLLEGPYFTASLCNTE